jgi:hypothetical protein
MTIFYINQSLIQSGLVGALSFICAMNFFVFISEGAGGWLWFLGNLVTKLSLVFTVPGIVFLCTFPVDEFCVSALLSSLDYISITSNC